MESTSGLHTKGHTITQVVNTQRTYNYTSGLHTIHTITQVVGLHTNDIQLHKWFTHK